MSNRQIRKRLEGLQAQITAHQQKIHGELEKDLPDRELVRHWEREIHAWEAELARLEQRLRRQRRYSR